MSNESQSGAGGAPPEDHELPAAPDEASEATDGGEEDAGELNIEVEPGEGEAESLEERLAAAEAKQAETYERLLRTTAELDNVRKRSRRELEDARIEGRGRTVREMLPVLDNLERALAHARQTSGQGEGAEAVKSILDGIDLVMRQFSQALERLGVKPVEAEGKPFDPNVHEAVSQVPTADAAPGTVVSVLQTGYTIDERLLRPSMVVVASAPPEAAAGQSGPNGHAPGGDEE